MSEPLSAEEYERRVEALTDIARRGVARAFAADLGRDLLAHDAALRAALAAATAERDVWSGAACAEERAAGNGPCGGCRHCLPSLLAAATARVDVLEPFAHAMAEWACDMKAGGELRRDDLDCGACLPCQARALLAPPGTEE